jgi:hypothetical protein
MVIHRRLADLAADRGDLDELRALEEGGNWFAAERLTAFMDEDGRLEDSIAHLTSRAAAGDALAAGRLPDLLSQTGHEEELEALAHNDPWYASGSWARHLANSGRLDEAIKWLHDQQGPGADLAASELAKLLAEEGSLEEALAVVRPYTIGRGDGPSVYQLVQLFKAPSPHRRSSRRGQRWRVGSDGRLAGALAPGARPRRRHR